MGTAIRILRVVLGLGLGASASLWAGEGAPTPTERTLLVAVGAAPEAPLARPPAAPRGLAASVSAAAQGAAAAALFAANAPVSPALAEHSGARTLPTAGKPGDVRVVATTTKLAARKRWVVPPLPLPPFRQWGRWLDEHKVCSHSSVDWMDGKGRWWHTEMRGYNHHPDEYRVGEGEFQASGVTTYGIFILPGRTDPEDDELLADERIECDYRKIEAAAREYGRKDRRAGEAGTGGNGSRNVGLGGPAFKPSQNSNTYVNWLLRQAGVRYPAPPNAIGWDTTPHFPYSSDAQE